MYGHDYFENFQQERYENPSLDLLALLSQSWDQMEAVASPRERRRRKRRRKKGPFLPFHAAYIPTYERSVKVSLTCLRKNLRFRIRSYYVKLAPETTKAQLWLWNVCKLSNVIPFCNPPPREEERIQEEASNTLFWEYPYVQYVYRTRHGVGTQKTLWHVPVGQYVQLRAQMKKKVRKLFYLTKLVAYSTKREHSRILFTQVNKNRLCSKTHGIDKNWDGKDL